MLNLRQGLLPGQATATAPSEEEEEDHISSCAVACS